MPRKQSTAAGQIPLLEVATKTAPCVPAVREAVRAWVEGGYRGAPYSDCGHSRRRPHGGRDLLTYLKIGRRHSPGDAQKLRERCSPLQLSCHAQKSVLYFARQS
jgi:hypothetical protein